MEVIKVAPRGYCKGVVRAIEMAKKCATEYPDQPITILGMLVHNQYVIDALKELGIATIDDKSKTRLELLDEIAEGVVIFTAHGVSPSVIAKAKKKGLICVNASCQDVIHTQDLVAEKLQEGYEILYIGKKGHPEAEAVCMLSPNVHLIETIQDIPELDGKDLFVTNQTTMSIFDIDEIFATIRIRYPHADFCEEICNATRIRQEAVANLAQKEIDVLYVVGDKHSNNSNRLAQIGKESGIPCVRLIDDVQDIDEQDLCEDKKVAVTSGASTPTYLTNQVIQYLQHWPQEKKKPSIILQDVLK